MSTYSVFDSAHLEGICRVLADKSTGLTGSELGKLLARLNISDPEPTSTKWRRLYSALTLRQQQDRCGNTVLAFIKEAMKPVSYAGKSHIFDERRQSLNGVLVFSGYELSEDGEIRHRQVVKTLTEAEEKAGRLRAELLKRKVHQDVLRFCRAELLQDNYFHAVLEATKSVAEKIRSLTGLSSDGTELVEAAFSSGKAGMPFLAFNSLCTESERSEQHGIMNLMKGIFGTFRNPTAHAAKISWNMSEQDALDLLTMASFLHRRLESSVRTPRMEVQQGSDGD